MVADNEITREEYDALVLGALSEAAFQAQVLNFLKDHRWLTFVFPMMKMTRAGWPDIVALHEKHPGKMLALELKKVDGKPSAAQIVVVGLLQKIPGVYARFLYPQEWPAVRDALLEGTLFDDRQIERSRAGAGAPSPDGAGRDTQGAAGAGGTAPSDDHTAAPRRARRGRGR